jgi:Zn-dependent protease with chaperone function
VDDGSTAQEGYEQLDLLSPEELKAELVLGRVVQARTPGAVEAPRALAMASVGIVAAVALVAAGMWLRSHVALSGLAVAGVWAGLIGSGYVVAVVGRAVGKKAPEWVASAELHQRRVAARARPEVVAVIERVREELPGRWWRSAHVYVAACERNEPAHLGICQVGGVIPTGGRLLVLVGEHLASEPGRVVHAVLAHEGRHVGGWRFWVSTALGTCTFVGWFLLGFTVPWPWLLVGAAVMALTTTAVSWVIELACDAGSVRSAGQEATLEALDYTNGVVKRYRAACSPLVRHALAVTMWVVRAPHPPIVLRRAIVRRSWR